ncbi:MAG: hypothetical protein EPO31_07590 [Gammaproteobacteria bacterium]|nr:MAG: hypothetical protein EPO31_07590 [Gammaproteobacteria bacterium]
MQTAKKKPIALIAIVLILVIIGLSLFSRRLATPLEPAANEPASATTPAAPPATAPAPTVSDAAAAPAAAVSTPSASAGSAQAWSVVEGESRLGFEGDYSGSGFSGQFPRFTAVINFDPDHLEDSGFNVTVDTTSVTTFNADWDSNLGTKDWFDFGSYPNATYVTHSFRNLGPGQFAALGTLDLKGHQKEVELRFQWTTNAEGQTLLEGQAKLLGDAEVNRQDFRIGDGEWYENSTVGYKVMVKVSLLLQKAPQ